MSFPAHGFKVWLASRIMLATKAKGCKMYEDITVARWLEEAMTSHRRSPSGLDEVIPSELQKDETPAISWLGAEKYGYFRDYYEQMIGRTF
ncbi:hypothetical protein HJA87_20995 [Rhizobium bangladeshense]|uniref:Uncharacterized protein n=1 Tax=Rhizobium bangladeshense TaxID=1138189 RepID=A0ABS7LLF9_9HYPH|nr:hypothetical protein [Rhizobium bangladeshense]MBY3592332.1 hypothetical protein [Rhizobium bangladeshense]